MQSLAVSLADANRLGGNVANTSHQISRAHGAVAWSVWGTDDPARSAAISAASKFATAVAIAGLLLMTGADLREQWVDHTRAMAALDREAVLAAELQPEEPRAVAASPTGTPVLRFGAMPSHWTLGGYSGLSYAYPSAVRFRNAELTDLTVDRFPWIGRPFKAPIYYGVRIQRWGSGASGGMLDFTHDKAIADYESDARIQGRYNGEDVDVTAKVSEWFSKLEFSHGHNMLTLNGLWRFGMAWSRFRPYVGGGAGVSLPHTEIGFRAANARTYKYQFAGWVAQALAGVEVQVGRASLFFEWKFSYAPYDVPLSRDPKGDILITDVWTQLLNWWRGVEPAGGRATTQLSSHHAIAGALVKTAVPPVAPGATPR